MLITVNVPDELAMQLRPFEKQWPHLLVCGLREFYENTSIT